MGLPNSGKTTLAKKLLEVCLNHNKRACLVNADEVRREANDWDFTPEGRLRQCRRMKLLSFEYKILNDIVISDFVAPTEEIREIFDADFTVWMDTIEAGRFEDTNKIFVKPSSFDVRVTSFDTDRWIKTIIESFP